MNPTNQKPLGSGFHAKSTATEVVADLNLSGKRAVVTGGYSGIGLETTRALAGAGVSVCVPARRPEEARKALSDISGHISVETMDLSDIESIRSFGEKFASTGEPLDILVNNAGIMACPEMRVGPGLESQLAVNHLGHMALFKFLLPVLIKSTGARVVAVSSAAHAMSDILWDDPMFASATYDKWQAYGQSKTANALFAIAVNNRYSLDGIRAFSVHPGGIFTPLQRHLPEEEMVALGWKSEDGSIPEHIEQLFKLPEQGAATTVWAATSPMLESLGGLYCEDCDVAHIAGESTQPGQHVQAWACDHDAAERLWQISEEYLEAWLSGDALV